MDVASTTSATTAQPSASLTAAAGDYQTFLNMMTTQLQNQDPTNPMDSDQFAVQLATFSGVEQQVQTNDLLTQMLSATASQNMAQMAGWVGQEARIDAPLYFSGQPITLSPNPGADADKAVLVVTDQTGKEVDRRTMPVSTANYQWDGTTSTGETLPDGVYTLTLESYQGNTLLGSNGVEYYAPVEEIRSYSDGIKIMVPGQIEVPSTLVTALRAPGSAPS
jgi:flagellar basal-body rod modification protein FlgD